MALPIISAPSAAPGRVIDSIRQNLTEKPAANDAQGSPPPAAEKTSKSKVVDMQQARQRRDPQKIEKVPSSASSNSRQAANAANEKAIERSQSQTNPLIPLLHSMNSTLSSMNGTLKSILFVLKKQSELLSDVLSKTDIGDTGGIDFGGGRSRERSRRDRARDRMRDRAQRRRDRANPPGRVRRGIRAGMGAGKKGLLGLAGVLGLSQLLPDEAQDAVNAAGVGADAADIARGGRGAAGVEEAAGAGARGAGAAAQGSRVSRVLGTTGNVLSKIAAPLTVGMALYENSDELLKTGKVDPLKQVEKMGGGVMDIVNPQDTEGDVGGMHLMKRLGGVGDVISGGVGTVLGAGTQVGSVINDMIPTDFSDSIVDGIVGLFGGETNADREKKAKEIQAKLEKELEEKKKIRLAAEQKAADEKAKKDAEEKAKQEEIKKSSVAPAIGAVPVTVDPSGKPVPALAPGQSKEAAEEIKRAATEDSLKPNMPTSVSISQPDGKPIPVMLTDDKGKPLITSMDAAAANTPGAQAPAGAPIAPPASPPAASPAPGTTPASGASQQPPPAAVSQQAAENQNTVSQMLGIPSGMLPKAGAGLAYALNQQNAIPEAYKNTLPGAAGQRETGAPAPRRQNSPEFSAQAQAQVQAAAQDRAIPAPPAPQNTTTNPPGSAPMASAPVTGNTQIGKDKATNIASVYSGLQAAFLKKGFTPEQSAEYAKAAAAQFAQESRWGEKQSGKNNFFGIKAKQGEAGTSVMTHEYEGGQKVNKMQTFKDYGSVEEGMAGYVDFITQNPRYAKSGAFQAKTAEEYAAKMQQAGYATDPNYAKNLTTVMEGKTFKAGLSKVGTQPTLGQTAQGAAVGVAGMLASQGVPGAAAVTGALASPTATATLDGLKFKNKAEATTGGTNEQGLMALAQNIQKNVSGMKYITAMNDQYHQSEGYKNKKIAAGGTGKSTHQEGTAMDFTLEDPKQAEAAKSQVEKMLKDAGVEGKVINEYKTKTSASTGGHIHVNFASKKDAEKYHAFTSGGQSPTQTQPSSPTLAQTAQGAAVGVSGMLASQGVPGAAAAAGTIANSGPISTKSSEMMKSVYQSFINAGFSENQAKAMTAEAGRENDFSAKTIFGAHTDAANSAKNIGYFSWQGNRATALQSELEKKGLWKDGHAVQSQETLDTMAKFAKTEMESGQYKGLGNFLENKNVDSETAAQQLGKGYIKWAYGQDVLKSGKAFDWRAHDAKRKGYYNKIDQLVSSGKATPEQAAQMKQQVTEDANKEAQSAQQSITPAGAPMAPQIAPGETMPASAQASDNRNTVSQMLGLPPEMISSAGAGIAYALNQQNAIPEMYRNNPNPIPPTGGRSQTVTQRPRRETAQFGQPSLQEAFAQQTFTGSVPPPANIPSTMPLPSELMTAPARSQQNFQLLGNPSVQAVLDTLQAGGANVMGAAQTAASQLGAGNLPGVIGSGLSAVDSIRQSGALDSMLRGDVTGVISRVAPGLSAFPGLQSVYDQSMSGGGGFARQFNDATGNLLRGTGIPRALGSALGTGAGGGMGGSNGGFAHQFNSMTGDALKGTGIPRALGASLGGMGGLAGNALGTLSNAASNLFSGMLTPQVQETSRPLEAAGFNDKQNDIRVAAANAPAPSAPPQASSSTRQGPERGSSVLQGDQAPLEVRNSESSIRRLTDMLIAFSFRITTHSFPSVKNYPSQR